MKKGTRSLKELWAESVSSSMESLLSSLPKERKIVCFEGKFLNEFGITSLHKIFQCLRLTGQSLCLEVEKLGKNQNIQTFSFSSESSILDWLLQITGKKWKFVFFESLFNLLRNSPDFMGSRIQVFFQKKEL